MNLFKPILELFKPSDIEVKESNVSRRNFLAGVGAIAGVVIAEQVFPFRTYSFAKETHSLNVPGSLFKVGDRFSTPLGVIYEVTSVGHSMDATRYSMPLTIINEYDFRAQTELTSGVDVMYGFSQKRGWAEPETIRQAVMQREGLKLMKDELRNFNRVIHGERKFELERNGSINKIVTRFYQGE